MIWWPSFIIEMWGERASNMDQKLITHLKQDAKVLALLFLGATFLFWVAFSKEAFTVVLRTVASLFWLFIFPGFYIMYYWAEQLTFMERFVLGILTSLAITGIAGYYLNVLFVHIKYYPYVIPLATLIVAAVLIFRKASAQKQITPEKDHS